MTAIVRVARLLWYEFTRPAETGMSLARDTRVGLTLTAAFCLLFAFVVLKRLQQTDELPGPSADVATAQVDSAEPPRDNSNVQVVQRQQHTAGPTEEQYALPPEIAATATPAAPSEPAAGTDAAAHTTATGQASAGAAPADPPGVEMVLTPAETELKEEPLSSGPGAIELAQPEAIDPGETPVPTADIVAVDQFSGPPDESADFTENSEPEPVVAVNSATEPALRSSEEMVPAGSATPELFPPSPAQTVEPMSSPPAILSSQDGTGVPNTVAADSATPLPPPVPEAPTSVTNNATPGSVSHPSAVVAAQESAVGSETPQNRLSDLSSAPPPTGAHPQEPHTAGSSTAVTEQPPTRTYRVRRGDTLWSLARRFLGRGARWRELYELNRDRLPHPDRLAPGMELRVPVEPAVADRTEQTQRLR